jgi:hypothetical protein
VTVHQIQVEIAGKHGLEVKWLRQSGKVKRPIQEARDEAIWVSKRVHPSYSLAMLGRLFNMHHTSILTALRRVGRRATLPETPPPEAYSPPVKRRLLRESLESIDARLAEIEKLLRTPEGGT